MGGDGAVKDRDRSVEFRGIVEQVHIPHPGGQQDILVPMLGNTEVEIQEPEVERPEAATLAPNELNDPSFRAGDIWRRISLLLPLRQDEKKTF